MPDDEGAMYRDLSAARRAATKSAWEMMAQSMRFEGLLLSARVIEIMDVNGALIATVSFADLVRAGA